MAQSILKLTSCPDGQSILLALNTMGCTNVKVESHTQPELSDYFDYHKGEAVYEWSLERMCISLKFSNSDGKTSTHYLSVYFKHNESKGGWIAPQLTEDHTYISMDNKLKSIGLFTELASYFGGYVIPQDYYDNDKPKITFTKVEQSIPIDLRVLNLTIALSNYTMKEQQKFMSILNDVKIDVKAFLNA